MRVGQQSDSFYRSDGTLKSTTITMYISPDDMPGTFNFAGVAQELFSIMGATTTDVTSGGTIYSGGFIRDNSAKAHVVLPGGDVVWFRPIKGNAPVIYSDGKSRDTLGWCNEYSFWDTTNDKQTKEASLKTAIW